jgi:hypothetical protein
MRITRKIHRDIKDTQKHVAIATIYVAKMPRQWL